LAIFFNFIENLTTKATWRRPLELGQMLTRGSIISADFNSPQRINVVASTIKQNYP